MISDKEFDRKDEDEGEEKEIGRRLRGEEKEIGQNQEGKPDGNWTEFEQKSKREKGIQQRI